MITAGMRRPGWPGGCDASAHDPGWSPDGPVMDCPRRVPASPGQRGFLSLCPALLLTPASGFLSKHDLDYRCHGLHHISKKIQLSNHKTHFDLREGESWRHFLRTVYENLLVSCCSHVKISVDCFQLFWLILVIGGMSDQSPAHHQISHIITHSPRPLCLLSSQLKL